MSLLYEGQILTRQDMLQLFNIASRSFAHHPEIYVEKLHDYCEYDLCLTPGGRFKSLTILKIKRNFYGFSLKSQIQNFCEEQYKNFDNELELKEACKKEINGGRNDYIDKLIREAVKKYNLPTTNESTKKIEIINTEYNGPGIYGIYYQDELLYLGKSIHIKDRLQTHLHALKHPEGKENKYSQILEYIDNNIEKLEFKVLVDEEVMRRELGEEELRLIEQNLLLVLRPKFNTNGVTRPYSNYF